MSIKRTSTMAHVIFNFLLIHKITKKTLTIAFVSLLMLAACTFEKEQPQNSSLPVITMDISPTDMLKIRHKRERAIQQGMLVSKSSDYVQVKLEYQGRELAAEVRLKGDWLDHLRGGKWSWRVKLADTCQLEGMQRFSLQHPRVRSYLDEWVFHKLLEQEDVLTPRYTFVQLVLNGRYKGVYALEEHFDKALLHANQRPEAPILKFAEDGFWQAQAIHKKTGKSLTHHMPVFEASEIEAFQKNKTLGDPYLKETFQAAKKKLESMRFADKKATDLVDVERMARWYALCDLVASYHSMRWHNMRFYYHPVKGVLEPVVYDAFGSQGAYRWFSKPLLGSYGETSDTVWLGEEMIVFSLLNDPDFRKSYNQYLQQYAQADFIETFMTSIKPELEELETVLKQEFSNYQYNHELLPDGARRLRKELKKYDPNPPLFERVVSPFLFDSCRSDLPIPEVALRVNLVSATKVELENWFCQPITVMAAARKKSEQRAIEPIRLPLFSSQTWPPSKHILSIKPGERYFYYSVPANDSWFRQKISPWPQATIEASIPLDTLLIDTTFMTVVDRQVLVKIGQYRLSQLVVIPRGYEFVIAKGTQIDMVEQAAMIICGNTRIMGDKTHRIRLYSSDNTSRGIHLIDASNVEIAFVDFEGHGDWWGPERWFKGGLSILGDTVNISHCNFSKMRGEDALNIVDSENVVLQKIHFSDCSGDALDLDYCKAALRQLSFINIGGDGLDFSGSDVKAQELILQNIVDKGISVGEESAIDFENIMITQANLGIAIKDASSAILNDIYIENCQYGMAVFNKKTQFTTASAEVIGFNYEKVRIPFVLEKEHQLNIDGQAMAFTHEKYLLFEVFYSLE